MSLTDQYKDIENKFIHRFTRFFRKVFTYLHSRIKKFMNTGKQRFTVMFIPHSERNVVNLKVSIFALSFLVFIIAGTLIGFIIFSTTFTGLTSELESAKTELAASQYDLELVREELVQFRRTKQEFEGVLKEVLETLGVKDSASLAASVAADDFAGFFGLEEKGLGIDRELGELRQLNDFLKESKDGLGHLSALVLSSEAMVRELPTMWPVANNLGYVTNEFGPSIHPFTREPYMHRGYDIAYAYGTPILATADGHVTTSKNDILMYGHHIIIRHRFGFSTKYAHMARRDVREGDDVYRGQQIGIMGSTGLSTGNHLHYEVRIGAEVLNPVIFLERFFK